MIRKLLVTLATASVSLIAVLPLRAQNAQPATPTPPNIIFFIADDLGYRDLGAFGQDKIRTPNIDRLAAEGIRLTTHYSGNAVCAPSRCVLLSGSHPGHAAVRDNGKPANYAPGDHEGQIPVPPDSLRLPLTLKKLGYTTGAFGKWGLGPVSSTGAPHKQGIDRFYGYICQTVAHNYYPAHLWDNARQIPLNNPAPDKQPRLAATDDPTSPASYTRFEGHDYAPDLIGAQALNFIRDNKDKPFFLYYPTIVPHLAYQVPDDSLKEYEGKFPEDPYPGSGDYVPHRAPRAAYAAMITRLDREVGRVVQQVHDLGLDDRTIFVFVSDNGAPAGLATSFFNSGHTFRGSKGTLYEGGLRVPAIVRWTNHIPPGSTSDRLTGFEDWLPTLLELVGAPDQTPPNIDGVSFAPTLLGKPQPPRPFLYREFPSGRTPGQFVRADHWKLLRHDPTPRRPRQPATTSPSSDRAPGAPEPTTSPTPAGLELYDLSQDPSEQTNVASQHPEVVTRLSKLLDQEHTPSPRFPLTVLNESR